MDVEQLGVRCYKAHLDTIHFEHWEHYSEEDRSGIDFTVEPLGESFVLDIQYKTSVEGITQGFVLPLPRPLPKSLATILTEYMHKMIRKHSRMYPDVKYILFVAKPCRNITREQIVADIWQETQRMIDIARELNPIPPRIP